MKSFLEEIVDQLISKHSKNLEEVTIVLPSKRAIVFFKYYLSKRLEKPVWLPKLISIEDFMLEISELELIDNLRLQFMFFKVYKEFYKEDEIESFDQFLRWSQTALYDFNEIDRHLVDSETIFTNLTNLKELELWSLNDQELTPFQLNYIHFFESLNKWYKELSKKLLNEQLAYQGLAYKIATEKVKNYNFTYKECWFVGLNALTKAEEIVVDHFIANENAQLFFDADKYYLEDESQEAGLFLRKHKEKWGIPKVSNCFDSSKNIQVIGSSSNIGQCKVACDTLDDFNSKDLKQSHTAVVLADEQLLFPFLNQLPEQIEALNITMGAPLKNTPIFNLIEHLFSIQLNRIKYKSKGFYHKDLIKFLRHPYLSRILSSDLNLRISSRMIVNNDVFPDLERLKQYLESNDSQDWLKIESLLLKWNNYQDSINSFLFLIDELKDQIVSDVATVESEVLFTTKKIINVLHQLLDDFEEEVELKTLKNIFNQLVSKEKIPFRGEPLDGLQLMGVLETRTLDFKNIILISTNEDVLPAGKSANSFIPFILKKHFCLPTHEERDAIFAYHFYRLIQRAKNVYLVYNTQNDVLGSGERSRFIAQLQHEYKDVDIEEKFLSSNQPSMKIDFSSIEIQKTDEVIKQIQQWLSSKVSPSALTTYNSCTLEFYFKYIARIKKKEELQEYIESDVFGDVVHTALERSYKSFLNQNLNKELLKKIQNRAIKLLEDGFKSKVGSQLYNGKNYLLWQVAKKMMNNFFEYEKVQSLKGEVKVLDVEKELSTTIIINSKKIELGGKLDRIEVFNDAFRIIDYKSGSVSHLELQFKSWNDLRKKTKSKAFQLMMYAYLFSKVRKVDAVSAGNYAFRNNNSGTVYVKPIEDNIILQKDHFLNVETIIIEIINEILDSKIPFVQVKQKSNCNFCDYKEICKR